MFDMDMLLAGTEIEYKGKKYIYLKTLNSELRLVAEIGATTPAPALVIPIEKQEGDKK